MPFCSHIIPLEITQKFHGWTDVLNWIYSQRREFGNRNWIAPVPSFGRSIIFCDSLCEFLMPRRWSFSWRKLFEKSQLMCNNLRLFSSFSHFMEISSYSISYLEDYWKWKSMFSEKEYLLDLIFDPFAFLTVQGNIDELALKQVYKMKS